MRRGFLVVLTSLLLQAQAAPPPAEAYAPPPGVQTGRFEGATKGLLRAGAPIFVAGKPAGKVRKGGRLELVLPAGNWVIDLHEGTGFDRVDVDEGDGSQPGRVGPLNVWPGATTTWDLGTSGSSLVHVVPDLPPRKQFTQARMAAVVVDLCTRRLGVRTAKGRLTALYDLKGQTPLLRGTLDASSPGLIAATPFAASPAAVETLVASCTWQDTAPIGLPARPTDEPHEHQPRYELECTGHFGRDLHPPAHVQRVKMDERLAGTTWYVDGQAGPPVVLHFEVVTPSPAARPGKAATRELQAFLFTGYPAVSPEYLAPRTPPGCR